MFILKLTVKTFKFTNKNFQKKLFKLKKKLKLKNLKIYKKNILKKQKSFTLLKSPHVYKKSQEHFVLETFQENFIISDKKIENLLIFLIIIQKTNSYNNFFISKLKKICL